MLKLFEIAYDWLKRLSPDNFAKFTAYWLAPGFILAFTITGVVGGNFAIETTPPIMVSELRTELSSTGAATHKPGFVVVIEPVASDFRFQLPTSLSRIWSSLNDKASRANKDRLVLDGSGLISKAPFRNVGGPVTVVVEGQLNPEIQIPGGVEKVDDVILRSRRSVSLVTSILLVCVFAFGMSSVTGLPSDDGKQHA